MKTNIQIMADIMCIGCESGSDCGHWHPPIPKNLNEFELDEWFDNQAEILEMKKLEEMKEEEEVIFENDDFVINVEEEREEFVIDIASEDEVQMKSKLKSTSPEWNPNSQWPIRCVNCQEKYPEDHDGEGFEQGGWYCPECWDIEFL